MGSSASISCQDDEVITRDRAIELSGEYWNEEEWNSIATDGNICGQLWNSKVTEFISQLNRASDCPTQRSRRPGLDEREFDNEEWCFVVGSLVNPIRLLSQSLEPFSSVGAVLRNYQLTFVPSDALLIECQGSTVHGVLHKIHSHELSIIDQAINSINYGDISIKKMKVSVYQYNGIEVECWIHTLDVSSSPSSSSSMMLIEEFCDPPVKITNNKEEEQEMKKGEDDDETKNETKQSNKDEEEEKEKSIDDDEDYDIVSNNITEVVSDLSSIADLVGKPNFKAICYQIDMPEQRLMETLIQGYVSSGVNSVYLEWLRNFKTKPRTLIENLEYFPIPREVVTNCNHDNMNENDRNSKMIQNLSSLPVWNKVEFLEANQKEEKENGRFLTCCNGKVLLFNNLFTSSNNNEENNNNDHRKPISMKLLTQMSSILGGKDSELVTCFEQYDPLYGVEDDVDLMSAEHRNVLEDCLRRSPIGHLLSVVAWRVDVPAVD